MLGELSEKERAEVEMNLQRYPELRRELASLEEVQEQLLMRTGITPRVDVRKNLFEKVKASGSGRTLEMSPVKARYWRLAVAASIAVAIFSSFMAFHYRNELKNARRTLTEYIALNQQMAQDYNAVNERLDIIEKDLRVIEDPDFIRVALKGTQNAPQSLAIAYWNSSTAELFLRVENLKQLSADNQYQLWAIVNGKPVSAGVFDPAEGLIKMKGVKNAAAFAITIEPYGGKESPTLETMQVTGNVEKG